MHRHSNLRWSCFQVLDESACRRRGAVVLAESELDRVVTHVIGPCGNPFTQALLIVRKKRTGCFFKAGHVSSDGRHEVISRFLRLAPFVAFRMRASVFSPRFAEEK